MVHAGDGSFRLDGMGVTAEVDLGGRRARLTIPPSPHALAVVFRHLLPVAVEDGLVLHAALLARGERAWLCCGPSGAGKSTLARLLPAHARCDEMAAVRCLGGRWQGEALPFWQSRPGRSPLEAVYLLRHGEAHRRRQLDRRSAVRQLLPHLLWPTGSPPALDRALGMLCDLVGRVSVYDLEFLPRPDVLEVIARAPDEAVASSSVERSAGLAGLLARAEERLIPVAVTLELTGRCNFACRHCAVPDHQAADALTTDRLVTLLDELAAMGTLFLTFTGGEPLLRRDWAKLASRARQLGFSVRLFTNASRVDERAADLLARLPAAVEVSLYSMNPAVFEGITGAPGSLARTLAGVERLVARGVEVTLKAPAMTVNLGDVGEVREYARAVGAAFQTDALIVCRDDGDPAPLCLRVPPRELGDYQRTHSPGAGALLESAAAVAGDEPPCAAGTRMAAVTAAGDVLACLQLRTPAGNLNRESFCDIWERSPWLERLRRVRVRDLEECAGCTRLAYCQRCPAQALVEDGDLLGPSRWSCEHAAALEHSFARDP